MILSTKRLKLRPLKKSDTESLIKNINNLDVSRWLLLVPYPYTRKDATWWINNCDKEFKKKQIENYNLGIELLSEKSIIGGVGLTRIDKPTNSAELGYWLGENYHGQGYGSEALKEILHFAFGTLHLGKVYAGIFRGNVASEKLLRKFGFKKEGVLREAEFCKADKQIKDVVCYGLLRKEWKK